MNKVIVTIVFLWVLIPFDLSLAALSTESVKVYSGVLHQKKKGAINSKQCFIEFKSPIPFSHQTVSVLPQDLKYDVVFNDKDVFRKFVIKIYTDDDQEYSIDSEKHLIDDPYLIYLILGSEIDHLEISNTSGDNQDEYILDKVEIHDHQ